MDERRPDQHDTGPPEKDDANEAALDRTIAFWEPLAGHPLSREDARQIRENLTGFFRVLLDWDAAAKAREADHGAEDRAA